MAIPFKGNTSSEAMSPQFNLSFRFDSFTLVNKTGGTIGVNVYIFRSGIDTCIMPLGKQINAGEMYQGTNEVVLLATEQIKVVTSGSLDYNFTLHNMESDVDTNNIT